MRSVIKTTKDVLITEARSNSGKMIAAAIKKDLEKEIDAVVEAGGNLLEAEYGKDSKEFKEYTKLSDQLYDAAIKMKQLFNKV